MTRILTADFGTTATKAALWDDRGLIAVASSPLASNHPQPGWAEQDPADWWRSLHAAVAQLPDLAGVDALGLCGARETFVAVAADLEPLGPGLLWSDRRAVAEADALASASGGRERFRGRTGLIPDGGLMVAKVAWLKANDPDRLTGARWLLSPRDWVAARLTGRVTTDPTMASKTGFFAITGEPLADLSALAGARLADPVPSESIVGGVLASPAGELGVSAGLPVIAGAGDRACEVLGTGASGARPTVSWGTTTNVAVPLPLLPATLPPGVVVTRGATEGWILEAGLSASGAAVSWLAGLCGATPEALYADAAQSAPGARGVVALPWLNGSRAPWWQPGARAAFLGLTAAHGRGDLARAIIEGVALDVDRSLAVIAPDADVLEATGGGSAGALWRQVLAGVTGRSVAVRAQPDAASAGACVLAAAGIGARLHIDAVNPVVCEEPPDPRLRSDYRELRGRADDVATTVVSLAFPS